MNKSIEHKIEAYLGGNLTIKDALDFEALMETDPELKKEVLLSKEVTHHLIEDYSKEPIPENETTKAYKNYLESIEAKQIKNKLRKIQSEVELPKENTSLKRYLLAVAAIAIVLLGSIIFFNFNQSSHQELYAKYYNSQDLPSIIKRDAQDSDFVKGVVAFQQENYTVALDFFTTYKKLKMKVDPSVYIYTGLALVEQKNIEDAIAEFDKMSASNSLDYSKGYWFKALAYLKIGETEKAKEVFNLIIKDSSNFNYKEAQELLDKI